MSKETIRFLTVWYVEEINDMKINQQPVVTPQSNHSVLSHIVTLLLL